MLDSITLYVGSYLSEIGDTFGWLVACINSADKAIKDFNFSGVRFLIQFVNKNTVDKFMDVLVSQFLNRRIFTDKGNKPFHVCAALGGGVKLLCQFRDTSRQRLFFFILAGSQESKLFIREFP